MGLDARPQDPLDDVGVGQRPPPRAGSTHTTRSTTYTNIVGKDNDLGYGIMRVDEDQRWHPMHLGQPLWNLINACFFEYGIAAYDLELGKNLAVPKEKRSETFKRTRRTPCARSASKSPRTTSSTPRRHCRLGRSFLLWLRTSPPTWSATCGAIR